MMLGLDRVLRIGARVRYLITIATRVSIIALFGDLTHGLGGAMKSIGAPRPNYIVYLTILTLIPVDLVLVCVFRVI